MQNAQENAIAKKRKTEEQLETGFAEPEHAETVPQENETTVREFINEIIDPMFEAFRSRQPVRSVVKRVGKLIGYTVSPGFDSHRPVTSTKTGNRGIAVSPDEMFLIQQYTFYFFLDKKRHFFLLNTDSILEST